MTQLIYILAPSHSGSTLLAMLLASHPDLCTIGEMKATSLGDIDSYRCSCGSPIGQCAFWSGIREDMARRGFEFDVADAHMDLASGAGAYARRLLRPLHRGPLLEGLRDAALALSPWWRGHLRELRARQAALAEAVCARLRARAIVDSSKTGLRLKYLLKNPALDVFVIRLIRDGRGVALTYTDPANFADAVDPNLRGGGGGGSRESERLSVADAAREWRRSNEEADALLCRLDRSRWTEVRYELLCADPRGTLARLLAAIGVDPARTTTDFRSVEHHVIGNGMRLDTDRDIRLDDRWRMALDAHGLAVFEQVAGEMNHRLGYS